MNSQHYKINNVAAAAFLVIIFTSLSLPSGKIYYINIKLVALIILILAMIFAKIKINRLFIIYVIASVIFCIIYYILGIIGSHSDYYAMMEARAFLVTIAIPMLTYILIKNRIISQSNVCKIIIIAACMLGLFKISVILYAMASGQNTGIIIGKIADIFNTQIITMPITGNIYRMQIAADFSAPLGYFITLFSDKNHINLKNYSKYVIYLLLFCSALLSYSRYIWLSMAIIFSLWLITQKNIKIIIISALLLLLAITYVTYYKSDLIEERFASPLVTLSDKIRDEQTNAILNKIQNHILLGGGFGTYIPTLIRDEKLKYLYEEQWLSFVMQTGLLGIIFILILALSIPILSINQYDGFKLIAALFYMLWLSSGLFNPYLISATSGSIFSYFIIIFVNKKYE